MKILAFTAAILGLIISLVDSHAEPSQRKEDTCNDATLDFDARMPFSKSRHQLSGHCFVSLSLPPKQYSATDTLWNAAQLILEAKAEQDATARQAKIDTLVIELLAVAKIQLTSERLAALGGGDMYQGLVDSRNGMRDCVNQALSEGAFKGQTEAGLDASCSANDQGIRLTFASANFEFQFVVPIQS